ncbi:hypothetical protein ACFL0X_00140 [Nanoarchaeota archaeon]
MKKVVIIISMIFLLSFVAAQEYRLEIFTSQETFEAGENITLKVNIYDSQSSLITDEVLIILEDAENKAKIEQLIPSNEFVSVGLGDQASHGQGKITANYKDSEATKLFIIEIKELAKFELNGENLLITNIGNTKYTKTIQIIIGETTGIKEPKLDIGEKISYKLVAPEGVYKIKITDGKTTLSKGEVKLAGTGKAIGALDERISQRNPITGGIRPDEESDENLLSYFKNSTFTYVFIIVIFGAMILLAIERRMHKKTK